MRVNPDKIGEFDRLKQKAHHAFSNIALWKMALDEVAAPGAQGAAKRTTASDDVALRTYSVVLGKTLG